MPATQPSASFSPERPFTEVEHTTWAEVLALHRGQRDAMLVPQYLQGLKLLGLDQDRIPPLAEVNATLAARTGWRGAFVKGLEEGPAFYGLLEQRLFPIGNFVRDRGDLNYTPAPDVIHDLYGHIPFYADFEYAQFSLALGRLAMPCLGDPARLRRLERFFWFTLEFGLVDLPQGRRIFGAGIASSVGECRHALSDAPEVLPFDVKTICAQEFRIDQMQNRLFVLRDIGQLYASLPALEAELRA